MFREIYGLRGAQEQIESHILTMVLTGFALLLEMPFSQPTASQSHGMEHYGSLGVKEPIGSPIHPMESHGRSRLLEMRPLHTATQ